MSDPTSSNDGDGNLILQIGEEELIVRRRYETASIFNDFLIALWFIIGSACFLIPAYERAGAWIFLIASVQFLIRPAIRLARHLHLQRLPGTDPDD